MTKIFAVYFQTSGFPNQSLEYAFECCRKQLGRYGISLSYSSPYADRVAFVVYVDCHRAVGVDFLYEFDVHILHPFLKIITILAFFHAVRIRLSDRHLVYSLVSVFEVVPSPVFNVSMFAWSLPVAVPFFISHSAASTSHSVISGTSFGSVWMP